ncbi:MAG TPA: restriction endonuclease subunit S, partial [Candidatus Krumholzibacteria bacterium]|nr:restriction endonuclease subunit S [Candidatus Krumholzibacteria bacterium]
ARNKQTTGLGHVTKGDLKSIEAGYPGLPEQRAIAHILGTLDDKIELNRRMNETLEAMARALFKSWFVDFDPVRAKMDGRWRAGESLPGLPADLYDLFPNRLVDSELGEVPEGWEVEPLDEIADFLNGAACQRFKAAEGEPTLPVIKIRELRAGVTESSDRASMEVLGKYLVQSGDVLFSWSGSLLCRLWTGEDGFLNQHVFKVSSTSTPKWLYFHWIREHLAKFQRVAADKATTMGHIKRSHLSEALTVIPQELGRFSAVFSPILDRVLASETEQFTLAALRDTLLPKLISGELRVKDSERLIEGLA